MGGHFHPNLAGSFIAARNSAGVNGIVDTVVGRHAVGRVCMGTVVGRVCMGIVDTEGSSRVCLGIVEVVGRLGIVEVVGRGIEVIYEGAEVPT